MKYIKYNDSTNNLEVIPEAVRMKENKRTWQFGVRNTAHDITELSKNEDSNNLPTCT